jgi:hypothetical protein
MLPSGQHGLLGSHAISKAWKGLRVAISVQEG